MEPPFPVSIRAPALTTQAHGAPALRPPLTGNTTAVVVESVYCPFVALVGPDEHAINGPLGANPCSPLPPAPCIAPPPPPPPLPPPHPLTPVGSIAPIVVDVILVVCAALLWRRQWPRALARLADTAPRPDPTLDPTLPSVPLSDWRTVRPYVDAGTGLVPGQVVVEIVSGPPLPPQSRGGRGEDGQGEHETARLL
jgi:hypothetical protein